MNTIQIIGMVIVLTVGSIFLLVNDALSMLSDISSLLFFFFSMLAMFALSTAIAHQLVKKNNYQSMKREYERLKLEMREHIGRFSYEISFTKEALGKHEDLLSLQARVKKLKGDNYETDIIDSSTDA
jgi:hypothetical protein